MSEQPKLPCFIAVGIPFGGITLYGNHVGRPRRTSLPWLALHHRGGQGGTPEPSNRRAAVSPAARPVDRAVFNEAY